LSAEAIPVSLPVSQKLDFPALVKREAPGLLAYFGRRVTSADDAADLLGDTLVVAWRKVASVPRTDIEARMWLYGVARRVLTTHRRTVARRGALEEKARADATVHTDPPVLDHVRALIGDLDPVEREIIGLHYWEGFSLVEVAGILRMRPGTVRSRHARARAALRDALLDSGDVEGD
jgi:RNA polymerase sigma-70 factor (ECF subfamily)